MKKYWTNILLYGLSLGLLLAALQFFQYKWVFVKNAVEWYAGLVALLFSAVGIWAGQKFSKKQPILVAAATAPMQPDEAALARLGITPRELEVLQLMAQGHSNQQIADQLYVSLNTVKTHISNLLSKLDAARRTQAIQKAKALGIIG